MGGLSAATLAPLSPDFIWQQLPVPAANSLEGTIADAASADAVATLEAVLNNAPPLEGAHLSASDCCMADKPVVPHWKDG